MVLELYWVTEAHTYWGCNGDMYWTHEYGLKPMGPIFWLGGRKSITTCTSYFGLDTQCSRVLTHTAGILVTSTTNEWPWKSCDQWLQNCLDFLSEIEGAQVEATCSSQTHRKTVPQRHVPSGGCRNLRPMSSKAHGTHEIFGVWWQGLHWKTILFCSEMMGEMVVSIRVSNWKKSGMWAKSSAGALLDCETHVSAVSLGSLFLVKRAKSKRNHSWLYMAIIVHGERCHDRWCLMKCNANHVSGVSGGDWTLCKLCTRKWNTMTHNFWWYVYVYYIYIYIHIYIHTCIYIPAKLESQEKLQLSHNRKIYLDSCNSPVVPTNSRNGKKLAILEVLRMFLFLLIINKCSLCFLLL